MDYYAWQPARIALPDRDIVIAAKPGLPDTLIAEQLLAESISVRPGERVLDLRCGTGLVGAALLWRGADVTLRDDHVVAVEAAKRTLALNGLTADVTAGEPASRASLETYDAAIINAPKGREVGRRLLRLAARSLKPGGRLIVGGANRAGVKSLIDDASRAIGVMRVVKIKASHRVAVGTRGGSIEWPDDPGYAEHAVAVRTRTWRYVSCPGVFAWDRLDDGSRALIEAMQLHPADSVLDLGCGSGLVGLVAAALADRVVSVDASALAVEAAQRTYQINRVDAARATVLLSDCASAVFDQTFEAVVTNPPFHQGVGTDYAAAKQFVIDAARVLKPGGRLWLVANRFLRYERELADGFADVRVAYQDNRFRVLTGVKQSKR